MKRISLRLTNRISFEVIFVALSIAVLTFIVFSPSLKCGFTNWDDDSLITSNPLVIGKSIQFKQIFTTTVDGNDYYPVTFLSFAFNYQLSKLNPMPYHLWNVLLHVINTLLVFAFVFIITRRNLIMASIVALFFGIHPMHIESVTWIMERKDVLFMFFFFSGLLTYLRFSESRKAVWYCITAFLFILSCLSKATAVVFPAILILIDYLLNIQLNRKMFIEKIPLFLISLTFIIITYLLHKNGSLQTYTQQKTFIHRIIFACYDLLWYVYKLLIPTNLSNYYPYPDENAIPAIYYLSPVILVCILTLLCFFARKEKAILFGLTFYFLGIVLMLQLIPTGGGFFNMADRYSYLPSVGLLFVAAHFINSAWQKKNKFRYLLMGTLFVYLCCFSFQTYARTKIWQNSETLWADAINKNPDQCYLGYYGVGYYYENEIKDFEKALTYYNKAIEINPKYFDAYNHRGLIYLNQNKYDLAMAEFTKAIHINQQFELAYFNRGNLYYSLNNYDLALADYNKITELNPNNANAYEDRGLVYYNRGQYDLAYSQFKKAIALNTSMAGYFFNLSKAENVLGKKEEARTDALKAKELGMLIDDDYLKELGL